MQEQGSGGGDSSMLRTRPNTIIRGEVQGEYVVRGAKIKCSKALKEEAYDVVNLPLCHGVYSGKEPLINIKDMKNGENIVNGFGICSETGTPCVDEMKFHINWINRKKIRLHIEGEEAVTTNSFTMCSAHGGEITFENSGQTALFIPRNEKNKEDLMSEEVRDKTMDYSKKDNSVILSDELYEQQIQPVGVTYDELRQVAREDSYQFIVDSLIMNNSRVFRETVFANKLNDIGMFSRRKDINSYSEKICTLLTSSSFTEAAIGNELKSPFYIFQLDSNYKTRKTIYLVKELENYNFLINKDSERKKFIEMFDEMLESSESLFIDRFDESINNEIYRNEVRCILNQINDMNKSYNIHYDKYKDFENQLKSEYDKMNSFENIYHNNYIGNS